MSRILGTIDIDCNINKELSALELKEFKKQIKKFVEEWDLVLIDFISDNLDTEINDIACLNLEGISFEDDEGNTIE